MKLTYTIDDLDCLLFTVQFEFHRELDGMLVFDGAWTIIDIVNEYDEFVTATTPNADQMIHRWLAAGGEDIIYSAAKREFK